MKGFYYFTKKKKEELSAKIVQRYSEHHWTATNSKERINFE